MIERCISLAVLFFFSLKCFGNLVDPLLWQEMVERAEFVGVVECETAGGIVAEYKVLDAWKGATNGQTLRLFIQPNEYGPRFPIILNGAREVVAGFKTGDTWRTPSMFTLPLWWRKIPADYRLAFMSDSTAPHLTFDKREDLHKNEALISFRGEVSRWLKSRPEERELQLLKDLSAKYLSRLEGEMAAFAAGADHQIKDLQKTIANAKSTGEVVTNLLAYPSPGGQSKMDTVETIFKRGGREESVALLKSFPVASTAFPEGRIKQLISYISGGSAQDAPTVKKQAAPAPVNPGEMEDLIKELDGDVESAGFNSALQRLSVHAPDKIAELLIKWEDPGSPKEVVSQYKAASLFASLLPPNRSDLLEKIVSAKAPMVTVAGATYLGLRDWKKAETILKQKTSMEGPAGLWAAFSLARRGDKAACERLIKSFGSRLEPFSIDYLWQSQTVVLLSNSAKKSKLPAPVAELSEVSRETLQAWWDQNHKGLTISDPWLPLLTAEKQD